MGVMGDGVRQCPGEDLSFSQSEMEGHPRILSRGMMSSDLHVLKKISWAMELRIDCRHQGQSKEIN